MLIDELLWYLVIPLTIAIIFTIHSFVTSFLCVHNLPMAARQITLEPSRIRSKATFRVQTTCRVQTCHRRTVNSEHKLCLAHMDLLAGSSDQLGCTFKLQSTRYHGEFTDIFELPKRTVSFKSISDDFIQSWLKKNAEGIRVENIYKIIHAKRIIDDHDDYRKTIEQDGNFVEQGLAEGNERLLYHGTDQSCHISFNSKDTKFCGQNSSCAMCGLIMNSFDRDFIGRNRRGHTFQRLGSGFYFSDVPSKCHYYGQQGAKVLPHEPNRTGRVMFVCKVVLGNEWIPETTSQSLRQAPAGYHSTRGELGKCGGRGHGTLNYREWAVYDERACVPVHLIVYSYTSTTE